MRPGLVERAAVARRASPARATAHTLPPACASATAMARPIPELAPVTRQVRPCSPSCTDSACEDAALSEHSQSRTGIRVSWSACLREPSLRGGHSGIFGCSDGAPAKRYKACLGERWALMERDTIGGEAYALMQRLFPFCRSLTGSGVRATFDVL